MIKDFEYLAPKTVEEVLTLLFKYKGEAKQSDDLSTWVAECKGENGQLKWRENHRP